MDCKAEILENLKISQVCRALFRWTKEMAYADYYERALTNGVLSIQRGKEPGIMIYMLPLGPGQSKASGYHKWGSKFNDFWCCYGIGSDILDWLQVTSGFQKDNAANQREHLVLLLASVHIRQISTPDQQPKEGSSSILNFRIPFWTT